MSFSSDLSGDSDDAFLSDKIADLIKSVSQVQTTTETTVISRKSLPDVTIFPTRVKFPTTFPNIPLQQKIIVSNGGTDVESFRVSLDGDSDFEVITKNLVLPPGGTMSVIISFTPKTVGLFHGSLLLHGRSSLAVSITGHSVPSPLEFQSPNSDFWVFPKRSVEKVLTLNNQSLSLPLRVVMASNSSAFRVTPNEVEIAPASSADVRIAFSMKQKLPKDPVLSIQCAQSGDSVMIPLRLETPKPKIDVDFGITSVGLKSVQILNAKKPQTLKNLSWPFSTDLSEPSTEIRLEFCANRADEYAAITETDDAVFMLRAFAVDSPYSIKIPSDFPKSQISVKNTSDGMLHAEFGASPRDFSVTPKECDIRPGQNVLIAVVDTGKNVDMDLDMAFVIQWSNDEHKNVVDVREIPYSKSVFRVAEEAHKSRVSRKTEVSLDALSDKRKHEYSDEDVSASSRTVLQPETDASADMTSISKRDDAPVSLSRSEATVKPTASRSVILLPRVSQRSASSCEVTIYGEGEMKLQVPRWVKASHYEEFNTNVKITSTTIPSSLSKGVVNVNQSLRIPVVAYRGSAEISMESTIEMTEISDSQYSGNFEIKNNGGRSGFVVFTSPDESEFSVRVSPVAAVIPANSSVSVEFSIISPLKDTFKIPVAVYSGDEIMRQMRTHVAPSDFFSAVFGDHDVESEIDMIKDVLDSCSPREIMSLFKKQMSVTNITIISPEKTLGFKQVTISPTQLEFIGTDSSIVSILNLSPHPLDFVATPQSSSLSVSPLTGLAPPYGEAVVTVQMRTSEPTALKIVCGSETFMIPVSSVGPVKERPKRTLGTTKRPTNSGSFCVNTDTIDFGYCASNSSTKKSITLSNDERRPMILDLRTTNPDVFICQKTITIPASGTINVDIEFAPDTPSLFSESLIVQNHDNQFVIALTGEVIEDDAVSMTAAAQSELEFPSCEPGTIRRAQLRISNRTDAIATIDASVTTPFHCPYATFDIEPFSYVIVPIRFIPMEPGEYEGVAEFASSTGTTTTVQLYGCCY